MYKKLILTKILRTAESCPNFKSISEFPQNFRCASQWTRETSTDCVLPYQQSILGYNECTRSVSMSKRNFGTTPHVRGWRSQMGYDEQRRKAIPKLIYLHNPWKYLVTKCNLWKLQWLWDPEFIEEEFIRGAKQAAIVLTDIIRTQNASKVGKYTTPLGFQQITRDMMLSRNDARLKLVKFDTEHIRRAIPMKVATRSNFGKSRKYCFIDMLFVGLRNTKDFETPEEVIEVREVLRRLDSDMKTPSDVTNVPHRIVFAEILIRFRRNYSDLPPATNASIVPALETDSRDWAVSFYKILTFDVLNYDPHTYSK